MPFDPLGSGRADTDHPWTWTRRVQAWAACEGILGGRGGSNQPSTATLPPQPYGGSGSSGGY